MKTGLQPRPPPRPGARLKPLPCVHPVLIHRFSTEKVLLLVMISQGSPQTGTGQGAQTMKYIFPHGTLSEERSCSKPSNPTSDQSNLLDIVQHLSPANKTQAFKALRSEAKADMRANKILRDEMALQEVGELEFSWDLNLCIKPPAITMDF